MLVRTCAAIGAEDKAFPVQHVHRALSAEARTPFAEIRDAGSTMVLRRENDGWNLSGSSDRRLVPGAMSWIAWVSCLDSPFVSSNRPPS